MTIQSKLGRWDLTMLVVSFIIGVGIFRNPSDIARDAGTPFIFYASWILGGIISVCGALTFAEIGARLPAAGGYYRIFSYSYHPAFAFMFNWALVITNAGSAVAVGLIGAAYIQPVIIPDAWLVAYSPDTIKTAIAFIVITVLFLVNYAGIKMGSRVQNVLSALKIVMIVLLSLAVFGSHPHTNTTAVIQQTASSPWGAMGLCLVFVFFSCGGYQNTINLGADVKNPQKNMPLGILGGMAIVMTLYMIINIAYVQVIGFSAMKDKPLLAAELARSMFGDAGFKVTSIIIFTSVLGFLNASFMSNPRTYYAMAEDRILPPIFKKVNPKTQTQAFGLSFFFAIILISLFVGNDFQKIVNYVIFIDNLALVFAAVTIFVLRKKMKNSGYTGYKMKLFPFIPIVFILVLLYACGSICVEHPNQALIGLAVFFGGYPIYLLLKKLLQKAETNA